MSLTTSQSPRPVASAEPVPSIGSPAPPNLPIPAAASQARAGDDPLWRALLGAAILFGVLIAITLVGALLDSDGFVQGRWILICGAVASIAAPAIMLQLLLRRRLDRRRTREHLDALEALNQAAAALTAMPGMGMALLEQIGAQVQRLMRMPITSIQLLQDDGNTVRMVYSSGLGTPRQVVFSLEQLTGTRKCFRTGQILFASDTAKDADEFNLRLLEGDNVRSVLMLPMIVNGRPIGAILLADHVPRHFSDLEMRMAKLWGTQAAVTIVQNRLHEQLRDQVVTNQTLLRELNHRVKNNLAGIVGLLSMDHPDMSPDARQWLRRVTSRVQTVASAHALFAGGAGSVSIRDLVAGVLSLIGAIKPQGTRITTDLSDLTTPLGTDRAVTLAIVLHELCHNAIVHGLGAGGSLSVRAGMARSDMIVVEVIDEPSSAPTDGATRAQPGRVSTGMGLTLVSELVRRELQGRVSLSPRAGGGTIASVEFPVEPSHPRELVQETAE